MTPLVQNITAILSVATIIAQVFVLAVFVSLLYRHSLSRFVSKYILELGFAVSLGAILLSLFYSAIAGFAPCEFCWWQRIFVYPQAVLFAVAYFYKKRGHSEVMIITISLILSILGGALALYQYYAQTFNPGLLSACDATTVSCAKIYLTSFNYITIPLMSLTVFALLAVFALSHRRHR